MLPNELRPIAVPASAVPRATPTSPSGCTACTPVGDAITGSAISCPSTDVARSRVGRQVRDARRGEPQLAEGGHVVLQRDALLGARPPAPCTPAWAAAASPSCAPPRPSRTTRVCLPSVSSHADCRTRAAGLPDALLCTRILALGAVTIQSAYRAAVRSMPAPAVGSTFMFPDSAGARLVPGDQPRPGQVERQVRGRVRAVLRPPSAGGAGVRAAGRWTCPTGRWPTWPAALRARRCWPRRTGAGSPRWTSRRWRSGCSATRPGGEGWAT